MMKNLWFIVCMSMSTSCGLFIESTLKADKDEKSYKNEELTSYDRGNGAGANSEERRPSSQEINEYQVESWSKSLFKPANDSGGYLELQFDVSDYEPTFEGRLGEFLSAEDILTEIVNSLNNRLNWPRRLPVVFSSCGEENAFYTQGGNGKGPAVVICYELFLRAYINNLYRFSGYFANERELQDNAYWNALDQFSFVLLHELGHAVDYEFDIPTTGSSEDVADQFATIVSLHMGRPNIASGGVAFFMSDDSPPDASSHHSPSLTRAGHIACNSYGSNPVYFTSLTDLLQERAPRCVEDFEKFSRNWSILLSPISR